MPYCFVEHLYPGVPKLDLHAIRKHEALMIGDVEVMPIEVMHDKLPIMGFRIGKLAYITDMKTIAEEEYAYLEGVEILVVNALRFDKPHHSHQLVDDAIAFAKRVGAKKTYLVHVTHDIGFHDDANRRLPEGVEFAYDGEEVLL
jgi:phosphoribosyl 1,2-cyclic phosphate phosphodiesterase